MNIFQRRPIEKFISKKGKEIEVIAPTMGKLSALLKLVNDLTEEDTFLTFHGKPITYDAEKKWLQNTINLIENNRAYIVWAFYKDEMVGECSVNYGESRMEHVGKLGLMVAKKYRRDGIGRFLMQNVLKKAKEKKLKMVRLSVFSDNEPAIKLYKKLGFKKWGELPNGFFRKGKFSNRIDMYKELY